APMTPHYASPEQVRGAEVTTASDVYSLGVILYRLLAGRLPHQASGHSREALLRAIEDTRPSRPSDAVLEDTAPGDDEVSRLTGSTRQALNRRLTGDLDSIVLKALRPEANHRYRTPSELARDLERHLDGLPVEARQGSWRYRAGKFIRRHQLAVGLTTAAVLLLSSLSIFLAWQSAVITRERNAALEARDQAQIAQRAEEQVVSFLTELFDNADPTRNNGEEISARDVVTAGADQVGALVQNEPALGGRLSLVLAQVHDALGLYEEASTLFGRAAGALQTLPKPDHLLISQAFRGQAGVFTRQGKTDQAEALLDRAIDEARLSGSQYDLAASYGSRGYLAQVNQDFEVCIESHRSSIEIERDLGTLEARENLIKSLLSLGACLDLNGEDAPAKETLLEAIALAEDGPERFLYLSAFAHNNLGGYYADRGDAKAAYGALERSAEIFERIYGPSHENTAGTFLNLATMAGNQGRYSEAIANSKKALESIVQSTGAQNDVATIGWCNLGVFYRVIGDYGNSEEVTTKCRDKARESVGPQGRRTIKAQLILSELRIAQGQIDGVLDALGALKRAEDPETPWADGLARWYEQIVCDLQVSERTLRDAEESCPGALELILEASESAQINTEFESQLSLLELRTLQSDFKKARKREQVLEELALNLGDSFVPEFATRFARLRGELAAAMNSPGEAEAHYRRALSVGREAGFLDKQIDISKSLDGLEALGLLDAPTPGTD
ncbi:MAG: tetratricopeptide repeat-containing protein kinase family protein, partial [Acidobacteriota bacterium]